MDVLNVCLLINSLLALCCFGVAFRILRTDCEKGKRPTHVHKAIICVSYMRHFSVGESRSATLCSCVCGVAAVALLHTRFIRSEETLHLVPAKQLTWLYFHQPWLVGISRGSRGGASGLHDHPLLGRSLLHVLHLQRLPWVHVHLRPAKRRWRRCWTNRLLHSSPSRSRSEWCSVLWHALQQRASSQE